MCFSTRGSDDIYFPVNRTVPVFLLLHIGDRHGGFSQRNCVAINQRRAGPDKAITDFFIIVFIKTLLITLQDGKYL